MNQPFEAGKTAEELKIDTNRKFVVIKPIIKNDPQYFKEGNVITFSNFESDLSRPGATFKNFYGKRAVMYWEELAYVDEPEKTYVPRVGDIVSIEATIKEVFADGNIYIETSGGSTDVLKPSKVTLLSRKSPRVVTQEEVNAAFGEEVILGE